MVLICSSLMWLIFTNNYFIFLIFAFFWQCIYMALHSRSKRNLRCAFFYEMIFVREPMLFIIKLAVTRKVLKVILN